MSGVLRRRDYSPHPMLVAPIRFNLVGATVDPHSSENSCVYRGGFPKTKNLPFMETLQLRTVVTLAPQSLEEYEAEYGSAAFGAYSWAQQHGIAVHTVHVPGLKAKDKSAPISAPAIHKALALILDKTHCPLYVHDLDGSNVVGIVIACLRRLQGWSEQAWGPELYRYLRTPPPEKDHLKRIRTALGGRERGGSGEREFSLPAPERVLPWLLPPDRSPLPKPSPEHHSHSHGQTGTNVAHGLGRPGASSSAEKREAKPTDPALDSGHIRSAGSLAELSRSVATYSTPSNMSSDSSDQRAPSPDTSDQNDGQDHSDDDDNMSDDDEEEEEEDHDEQNAPISQMIDALDLL